MAAIARIRIPLRSSVLSTPVLSTKVKLNSQSQPSKIRNGILQASRRWFVSSTALKEKRYTEAHEWIELSEDGKTGTIGISTFAAKSLGDVVYVELPTPDLEVNAGDAIGAVESVKSASDIYAPIGGKVIEGNSVLEEKPGTINKGPEGEGWIAKIEIKDKGELDALMDLEAYKKHTEE